MYEKLSSKEQEMIRKGVDASQPVPSTGRTIRTFVMIVLIFFLFVLIGYVIISIGPGRVQ